MDDRQISEYKYLVQFPLLFPPPGFNAPCNAPEKSAWFFSRRLTSGFCGHILTCCTLQIIVVLVLNTCSPQIEQSLHCCGHSKASHRKQDFMHVLGVVCMHAYGTTNTRKKFFKNLKMTLNATFFYQTENSQSCFLLGYFTETSLVASISM